MMQPEPIPGAAPPVPEELAQADAAGRQRVDEQWAWMPPRWRQADRIIVRGTEWVLIATGALFAAMITLEVVSRYLFDFSISFVNAAARLLLVWFFMLGAGVAMRHGAHVGFELLLSKLAPHRRRLLVLAGLTLVAIFCVEMIWAGLHSLGPAMAQMEPGLGISLAWPIAAIPVGFALLLYHTLVDLWVTLRRTPMQGSHP